MNLYIIPRRKGLRRRYYRLAKSGAAIERELMALHFAIHWRPSEARNWRYWNQKPFYWEK